MGPARRPKWSLLKPPPTKCVQNEPKLYQEAARIFNLGGDVGKKCWENLSRDDVRTYFNDIGFQIKSLLGAAGLSK